MNLRLLSIALAMLFALASATAGAAATWTPYAAPVDGFTVSFPGSPKVASAVSTATVEGVYRTYSSDLGTTAYYVSVLHYLPNATPVGNDVTFRKYLDGYSSGSKCAIKSTRDLTISGQAALEAICLDNKAKVNHVVDVFLAGDYLYIVVSAGPKGYAKGTTAKRFRDSFSLQAPLTPAPPQPSASPVP